MWTTMIFGYYTEITSPPEDEGDDDVRPKKWVVRQGNNEVLLPGLPAVLQRLAPHMLGYVPYITVWAILMHSFFFNVGDAEQGPPSFVYIIVVGQLVVFTGFGVTQLVNQIAPNGPSWYAWGMCLRTQTRLAKTACVNVPTCAFSLTGEWSYLFLSLFSKGLLGLTLVFNVFLFDTFQDAVSDAQASS